MTLSSQSEKMEAATAGRKAPRVSVGLPVYNGARYVRQAIESVLSQSWGDFELVISDNASTDETPEICGEFAARDARVRYFRSPENRGITWNFRQVVLRSSGEFFLWMAHDDVLAPEYVQRCLETLQRDAGVVLCYSAGFDIDEDGNKAPHEEVPGRMDHPSARIRFRDLIRMNHMCEPIFGLIRADVLKRTSIHGDFPDSDRCVLAELALHGRFHRIPERLFFHREHRGRATRQFASRQQRLASIHPRWQPRFAFPHFRQFWEYLLAIHRAPLGPRERLRCYLEMTRWARHNAGRLLTDLKVIAYKVCRPLRVAFAR
jgi:glycosyltransferase involved in cell wall biosynthesis